VLSPDLRRVKAKSNLDAPLVIGRDVLKAFVRNQRQSLQLDDLYVKGYARHSAAW